LSRMFMLAPFVLRHRTVQVRFAQWSPLEATKLPLGWRGVAPEDSRAAFEPQSRLDYHFANYPRAVRPNTFPRNYMVC
jgi:hypothetical protein